jgi:M6 family metalloprotease-like protein
MRRLAFTLRLAILATALAGAFICASAAFALEPPMPGMVEQMKANGTWEAAQRRAIALGNYKPREPKLSNTQPNPRENPMAFVQLLDQYYGETQYVGKATSGVTPPVNPRYEPGLDQNRDGVIDERDLLSLGYPIAKDTAQLASKGTSHIFALLIEFPDYPHSIDASKFSSMLWGDGVAGDYPYESLRNFYQRSSYGNLNIQGDTYGWYTAQHNRSYYTGHESWIIEEALNYYDPTNDFSVYDNDGDGYIDYFIVYWTGPHGNWADFWWGWYSSNGPDAGYTIDGKILDGGFSWQWEYAWSGSQPPPPDHPSADVVCHETGHALGLPDLYDYESGVGPDGGVGGFDEMHANNVDHGCWNKFKLGWLAPDDIVQNVVGFPFQVAASNPVAAAMFRNFDPSYPNGEYFIIQNRRPQGNDTHMNGDGMAIWHIDESRDENGNLIYDNSYTSHKLVKLMEADGLNDIEQNKGYDAADFFKQGNNTTFNFASNPSSETYANTDSHVRVTNISAAGDTMTADLTLFDTLAPSVTITSPSPGDTVSGTVTIAATASDDQSVQYVDFYVGGYNLGRDSTAPYQVSWNTLLDFNGSIQIRAVATDSEYQQSSDQISVTVSNSGVPPPTFDDFEADLSHWRPISVKGAGVWRWNTDEHYSGAHSVGIVPKEGTDITTWGEEDDLRSERIDLTSPPATPYLVFFHKNDGAQPIRKVQISADEGVNWSDLGNFTEMQDWMPSQIDLGAYTGGPVYLRWHYMNSFTWSSWHLDDISIKTGSPPTCTLISPPDGSTVSGTTQVTADADDDVGVAKVDFYVNGALQHTATSAPFTYDWDTTTSDDHGNVPVVAIAYDGDGLIARSTIHVNIDNQWSYPVQNSVESDLADWATNDYSGTGHWQVVATQSNSPTHSWWMGDLGTGKPGANENDYLWYSRRVDLRGTNPQSPKLTFWRRKNMASGQAVGIYWYNSEDGLYYFGSISGSASGWSKVSLDLTPFVGRSGQVLFVFKSGSTTGGTGVWIDDLTVDNAVPSIASLSPVYGMVGDTVTIDGQGFQVFRGANTVSFNGTTCAAADYLSWATQQLSVKVPTGATSGNVVVTVDGNGSNGVCFQVTSCDLLDVSPTRVRVGDSVVLTGIGFGATQDTSTVRFWNGTSWFDAASYPAWSDTSITVVVPPGARTNAQGIHVTKGNGNSNDKYIQVVLAAPTLGGGEQY